MVAALSAVARVNRRSSIYFFKSEFVVYGAEAAIKYCEFSGMWICGAQSREVNLGAVRKHVNIK